MAGNWRSAVRRRCIALLLLAVVLRVLPQAFRPAEAVSVAEPTLRELPPLRFRAVVLKEPEPEPIPPDEPALPLLSLASLLPDRRDEPVFTEADAENLTVRGGCTLPYDKTALLLAPLPPASEEGPQLLIVQTHTTEAYTPEPGLEYEASDLCRTLDLTRSVAAVGARIAENVEAAGIGVIHDTTVHDYPAYSGAYERSAVTIAAWLEEYPSIRMVLDVHRDAFEEADGSMGGTAKDGMASVLLVLGSDQGGLTHPDWRDNLSAALKLQVLLDRRTPGLARPISLTTQRYNGHLTKMSMLVEFGAAGDTLSEALSAADAFSEALIDLLTMS